MDSYENWNPKLIGWGGFLKKLYGHYKFDGGVLILRIVVGLLLLASGYEKITNMQMTMGFFAFLGFPAFSAYFVSWFELLGGLSIILGFLNKPVAVAFATEMAVIIFGTPTRPSAIYFGHDYEFVLLGVFLALYVMGPGRYSLGYWWKHRKVSATQ